MKVTHPGFIDEIVITSSVYRSGFLEITLKLQIDDDDIDKFKEALSSLEETIRDEMGIRFFWEDFKARKVIDYLFQMNLISAADRAAIEEDIINSEKNTLLANHLSAKLPTDSVIDLLKHMCSPYIESVLEITDDAADTLKLFTYALSNYFNKDYVQKYLLIDIARIKQIPEEDVFQCSGEIGIVVELSHLNKIFNGQANLETTFFRTSKDKVIPTRSVQRKVVTELIIQAYFSKFSKLSPIEKFYAVFQLNMLTCPAQSNMYPPHVESLVTDTLKEPSSQQRSFRYLAWSSVRDYALYYPKFNQAEMSELRKSLSKIAPWLGEKDSDYLFEDATFLTGSEEIESKQSSSCTTTGSTSHSYKVDNTAASISSSVVSSSSQPRINDVPISENKEKKEGKEIKVIEECLLTSNQNLNSFNFHSTLSSSSSSASKNPSNLKEEVDGIDLFYRDQSGKSYLSKLSQLNILGLSTQTKNKIKEEIIRQLKKICIDASRKNESKSIRLNHSLFQSPFDAVVSIESIVALTDIIKDDKDIPNMFEIEHGCLKNHSTLFDIFQYYRKLLKTAKEINTIKPASNS